MAQQIKKKFIGSDQIDGSKIKLLEGQSIRGTNSLGQEVDLVKIGSEDKVEVLGQEVALKSQVDTEQSAREAGDQALQSSVDAESSRAQSAEQGLQSEIDAEEVRAKAAEQGLSSSISSEQAARIAGDESLQSNIDDVDGYAQEIRSDLDQEIVDRQSAVSSEEAARIAGDASLQSQINNIISNVDPAALDSLTEVVSAFQNADSDLQESLAALSATASSALASEVSRAQAAEAVLQSNIDTEESERIAADEVLDGKIDSEESARIAADQQIQSNIDSEVSNRTAADQNLQTQVDSVVSDLGSEISRATGAEDLLQSEINSEVSRATGEESRIEGKLDQEIIDRQSGDTALESRIVPMEDILDFQKTVIFENNSAVSADGESGVEDSQNREGWYYQNMSAGQKINWYFFDGVNQATIQKQDFSAYAVVTFDSTTSLPIMAVYTMPTGTNDVFPGFAHSRYIYSQFSQTPVVGKKYLIHIGDAPAIHPELPRIQVNLSNSQGEQLPTENVFTVSFGSNSGAAVGNVKLLVENLGVSSLTYKGDAKLKIKAASLKKLELEEAARIAGDASLQSQIDALDANFTTDEELAAAVASLQGNIDSEMSRAMGVESSLQSEISQEVSDRISGDSALSDRLTALEADPVTKSYVDGEVSNLQSQINNVLSNVDPEALDSLTEIVGAFQTADSDILTAINNLSTSASSALAQEVSDRQAAVSAEESARIAADAALDSRVEALETAPVTRIVEDEKHSVTTTLTHVMLDFKAEKIFKVVVGRMNAMKGEDYSVSEEGGKTKLTWIGSFAEGGMEAIESGDSVFCTYSTLESMTSGNEEPGGGDEGGEEPGGEEPSPELVPFMMSSARVWNNNGTIFYQDELSQEDYDKILVGSPANMYVPNGVLAVTVSSKFVEVGGSETFKVISFELADPAGPIYFPNTGYPSSIEFFVSPE